ncbi:FtsX-like permease family protein [Phycicoccus sp. Root101]|uniref:FtsX-like permease family protein n=1 Tax=Phycicoccus sp. Root101 TaxID=1736421 RepID=UPI000703176D|nr:FtsX-like permease family protein [Phycicoccus sp. Root101]KQU69187.1 hypothetical protein ASC58_04540 [Phycicoccus sp. Root101]
MVGLASFSAYGTSISHRNGALIAGGLLVVALLGLLLGSAAITYLIGRAVSRVAWRPALLVAGHRMATAPFTSSRATASVLLGVLLGTLVLCFKANFLALTDPADPFYAQTFRMIEVVLGVGIGLAAATLFVVQVEGLVARRRSLASLVATGTPRWVLARATLAETLLPVVPCVLLAAAAGMGAGRGLLGDSGYTYYSTVNQDPVFVQVAAPWLEVSQLVLGSIAAVLVMTLASLVMLWPSTRPEELRTAS